MARLGIIVAIITIVSICIYAQENLYSDKYDDIDVMRILNNEKLRQQYFKCVMDLQPCVTEDSKFFKEIFSEALQTNCKRCTEKQKEIMDTIVSWYTTTKPDEWMLLVEKSIENMKKKNAEQ